MYVVHRLPSVGVAVSHQAVAVVIDTALGGKVARLENHSTYQIRVLRSQIVQGRDVGFWNDQQMRGSLSPDVVECDQLIVFEHDF